MLFACQSPLQESVDGGFRRLQGTVRTRGSGFRAVDIDVGDEDAMMITAQPLREGDLVHVRQLVDPDGVVVFDAEDWFGEADEQKTNAAFLASVSNLNWPVAPTDAPLVPGRWTALVGLTDSEIDFVAGDVRLDVVFKRDADFDDGRVRVVLLHPEGEDPALRVALDQAKGIWTELYAQVGIEVDFEDWVTPYDDLSPPTVGDDRYAGIQALTGIRTVVVVLVDAIDTTGLPIDPDLGEIVGLAGGIPGAVVPTRRSAIQVGTLAAAGVDGRFEGDDIRLLAETMAHETAHYLGLFHPVEAIAGDIPWSTFDTLGDTPRCRSRTRCEDVLGSNLMFPFAVCDPVEGCEPQEQLTDEQGEVMQRYVGVD